MTARTAAEFHRETAPNVAPTLIEGVPGHGLVASLAVDQITDRFGLEQYGAIRADSVPPVASFTNGLVQDTVRGSGGTDPDVLTLQRDVPIPKAAFAAVTVGAGGAGRGLQSGTLSRWCAGPIGGPAG